jgi:CRISPR/Cas system-associated endonuclease/helicase Cas3
MVAQVEKRIRLAPERAQYLSLLAQKYEVSEEQIIDQVLDMVFSSAEPLDALIQRMGRISRSETEAPTDKHTMGRSLNENDFKRYLSEIGLLAPKQPPAPATEDRSPIHIQGKPLSETILEERP